MTLYKGIIMICIQSIDNLDFFKGFFVFKGERPTKWEKLFTNHMSDKCGSQNMTTLNKYEKDNPIINGQSMQVYHMTQRNGQMKLYIREDQIKTATK